jgi:PAS domain S-box-containing protein
MSNQDPSEPSPVSPIEELATPELAKAAESDEYRRLLDHLPIAIAVSKLAGSEQRISYANQAFETLTGRSFAELDGRGWSILDDFHGEDDDRKLGSAIEDSDDFVGVFRREPSDARSLALVQVYVGRIDSDDGTENYRLVALVDVAERERSQREEFERQIRDKDLQLKELQHRVKNNLQLIIGLIRLEARGERRGEAVDLDALAGRIESLRLLYDAISTNRFGEDVDLGEYLSRIAAAVVRSHGLETIRLEVKVELCPASLNVAIPAGLAVNELLTNAFKHAFQGKHGGVISLECLRQGEDRCRLVVADDGVGLPEQTSWPVPGKLGALIVQTLRENAALDLHVASVPDQGTRITLSFLHKAKSAKIH